MFSAKVEGGAPNFEKPGAPNHKVTQLVIRNMDMLPYFRSFEGANMKGWNCLRLRNCRVAIRARDGRSARVLVGIE